MSEYTIVNGELCHYGVKGQKWGVRRDYLAKDRAKAQKKLDNAKTERGRARAQEKVDRLAKADTTVYNNLKTNQRKRAISYACLAAGTVAAKAILRDIGDQSVRSLASKGL